jgi:uncharacterized protein YeaO (DUF488 family)
MCKQEVSMVQIQRAYEDPSPRHGYRVLVDRLWPRGVKKEALRLDLWAKDLAPSPGLRRWFDHDPARFRGFAERYRAELRAAPERALLAELARRADRGTVTLVYGARDEEHNGAVVLRDAIADVPRDHPRRGVQESARRAAPRHRASRPAGRRVATGRALGRPAEPSPR